LVDALICYKQKCKVASFNLAHPVYTGRRCAQTGYDGERSTSKLIGRPTV